MFWALKIFLGKTHKFLALRYKISLLQTTAQKFATIGQRTSEIT